MLAEARRHLAFEEAIRERPHALRADHEAVERILAEHVVRDAPPVVAVVGMIPARVRAALAIDVHGQHVLPVLDVLRVLLPARFEDARHEPYATPTTRLRKFSKNVTVEIL